MNDEPPPTGPLPAQRPRDHVIRAALPWRGEEITECGRQCNDVASCITLEQLRWRVKEWGRQRTAFTVCMTCYGTAFNAPRWESDPVGIIERECRRSLGTSSEAAVQLRAELRAIDALITAHREEFNAYLTTTNLADRRKKR